jgi:hypothetical protein
MFAFPVPSFPISISNHLQKPITYMKILRVLKMLIEDIGSEGF